MITKATLLNAEGEPERSYHVLEEARSLVEAEDRLAQRWLYTLIYLQGVTALRRGENDNCIDCRGDSSCILPIAPEAGQSRSNIERAMPRRTPFKSDEASAAR